MCEPVSTWYLAMVLLGCTVLGFVAVYAYYQGRDEGEEIGREKLERALKEDRELCEMYGVNAVENAELRRKIERSRDV